MKPPALRRLIIGLLSIFQCSLFFSQAGCQQAKKDEQGKTSLQLYRENLKKDAHRVEPTEEQRQLGNRLFDVVVAQCDGRFYTKYFVVQDDSKGKPKFYDTTLTEMKKPEWRFAFWNDKPEEVDRLNNIEIYATYVIESEFSRTMSMYTESTEYMKPGPWRDWIEGEEIYRRAMKKRNGRWEPEITAPSVVSGNGRRAPTCEEVRIWTQKEQQRSQQKP